ncbi:MAG: fimbrillin family protein [Rikenellaceae bacterium]
MKKLFTLTLTLLIVAIVGSSCRREVEPGTRYEPTEITFTSSINTRVTDTQFDNGDKIYVMGISDEDSYALVQYAYSGGIFSSDTPFAYEEEGDKLEFRAVYPLVEFDYDGSLSFSVLTAQNEGDNYEQSDLLSSLVAATNEATPKLTFDHLLSEVVINVVSSDVDLTGAVATLEAKIGVDANILTDEFVATGDVATTTMAEEGDDSFAAIVVPQTIAQGVMFININAAGSDYEVAFETDKVFESGVRYEFDVEIEDGEVTFIGMIEDWEDEYLYFGDEILSISIVENEYQSLLVDVDVADSFTGTYALFYMPENLYEEYNGDWDAYAFDFIAQDIVVYGTDYTVADGIWVFEGDIDNFNFWTAWTLPEGSTYYLVAAGADADGNLTTNVVLSEPFVVQGAGSEVPESVIFPDVEFGGFEIYNITMSTVTFSVYPEDYNMPYVVLAITKEYYNSVSDEELFIDDMEYLEEYYSTYYACTLSTGLSASAYYGELEERTFNGFEPGGEYVLYAYGVDASTITPLSKMAVCEFTTPETDSQGVSSQAVSSSSNIVPRIFVPCEGSIEALSAGRVVTKKIK